MSAKLSDGARCKLTVIAEATAECKVALDPNSMAPYDDHFHPIVARVGHTYSTPDNRRIGAPFVAITVEPHERQVCKYDRGEHTVLIPLLMMD